MKSWSRQQLEAEQKKTRQTVHREKRGTMDLGPEDAIQYDFFQFIDTYIEAFHVLRAVFAIPNGSAKSRLQRAVMWATGLKPGVPDVFISVPRQGFAGFYIEFKSETGRLSPQQKAWIELLTFLGYKVEVHRSWITAADALIGYLDLPINKFKETL